MVSDTVDHEMESPGHPPTRTFPLLGEPLAVDLVNTVAAVGPNGALVDLIAAGRSFCGGPGSPPRPSDSIRVPESIERVPGDLPRLQALREALRSLFRATMRDELEMEALEARQRDERCRAVRPGARLAIRRPAAARSHREAHEPICARPLAAIARSGIELLGSEQRRLLRTCEGPGCVLIFVAAGAATGARRPALDLLECGFSAARFDAAIHGDQSLRNHSVGSRCRSAASGPRLVAEIFTRMSSAAPLAYSTNTSK